MALITYSIDGIDLSTYNVRVSASLGLLDSLERKAPLVVNWDDYNGEAVDVAQIYYNPRNIVLQCSIFGTNNDTFHANLMSLKALFEKAGTQRLMLDALTNKPLVYEVYLVGGIDVQKQWRDGGQVFASFELKLREPEPCKVVYKYTGAITGTMKIASNSLFNIYFGDGTSVKDLSGASQTISHVYSGAGDKYMVITGNITDFTFDNAGINGTLIWSKLQ